MASECTFDWALARLCDIRAAIRCDAGAMDTAMYFSRERQGCAGRMNGLAECGPDCEYAWARLKSSASAESAGRRIAAIIHAPAGALIFRADGTPVCASGMGGRAEVCLSERAVPGETFELWVECPAGADVRGFTYVVNENVRRLYFDMQVLIDLAGQLPDGSVRRAQIGRALEQALIVLTEIDDGHALGAAYALRPELERACGDYGLRVLAVGTANVDAGRSDAEARAAAVFANAIGLMQYYDDCTFSLDQAYLFEAVKRTQPVLYSLVRERVSQGRIETMGGWCAQDGAAASGETLVRSIVMGKRFCARELGQDVNVMRIHAGEAVPAQLPQILALTGIHYALCDGGGNSCFWWQGLGGARVLTHTTENAADTDKALPGDAIRAAEDFAKVCAGDETLMLFGGDAGADDGHMERIRRMGALKDVPPVRCGRAGDFFERLRLSHVELPTRAGEIMPYDKSGECVSRIEALMRARRVEQLLRLSEIMFTALSLRGADYPRAELNSAWQALLLAGAPGGRADAKTQARLNACEGRLNALIDAQFGEGLDVIINPHAWTVDMWLAPDGECEPGEAMRISLPPISATSATRAKPAKLPELRAEGGVLENDRVRLNFDERGYLAGVRDVKAGYDMLRGAGNQLSVYADDGDAAHIDPRSLRRRAGAFVQVEAHSEAEGAVCRRIAEYRFGDSTISQTVEITAGSARVDFITRVDWRERNKLLRAEFPLNISAGRLLYAAQFGHTEQSGGLCEPRDIAAQGWVSLEQAGRGAALMSAGGYGYSCAGGLLCLNLIRACEGCNDEGVHEFRYALYLHSGGAADVVRQAALFSQPPIMRPGLTFGPLCWLDAAGVMLDAVKLSEDGGDVVVRMHECAGASVRGSLRLGFEASAASVCDLMERATAPLGISDGGVMLDFAPFEIKTVMLAPAGKGGLGE